VSFSETGIKVAAIMLDPDDAIDEKRLGCVYEKEAALVPCKKLIDIDEAHTLCALVLCIYTRRQATITRL
jgi:hypothetical protein